MSTLNRQAGLPIRLIVSARKYSDLRLSCQCFIYAQRLEMMLSARAK